MYLRIIIYRYCCNDRRPYQAYTGRSLIDIRRLYITYPWPSHLFVLFSFEQSPRGLPSPAASAEYVTLQQFRVSSCPPVASNTKHRCSYWWPEWQRICRLVVYWLFHRSSIQSIVGVSINQFEEFLSFCSHCKANGDDVGTAVLLYCCCCA